MQLTERIRSGLRRRLDGLRHRGDEVQCPNCGRRWSAFKPQPNRPQAICWRCGSHERHRAQWLLLAGDNDLLGSAASLLHFAPEYCLEANLRTRQERAGHRYVTADLSPDGVDLQLDLTALALESDSFDAVICSHVLEHIEDDRAAMAELCRITRPGGWCLVAVPLDTSRAATYEDRSATLPADREREFWQADHVRLYAPDIAGRLEAAGFGVEVIRPAELFGEGAIGRYGLQADDWMFLCRPAGTRGGDPA